MRKLLAPLREFGGHMKKIGSQRKSEGKSLYLRQGEKRVLDPPTAVWLGSFSPPISRKATLSATNYRKFEANNTKKLYHMIYFVKIYCEFNYFRIRYIDGVHCRIPDCPRNRRRLLHLDIVDILRSNRTSWLPIL